MYSTAMPQWAQRRGHIPQLSELATAWARLRARPSAMRRSLLLRLFRSMTSATPDPLNFCECD